MRNLKRALSLALASVMLLGMMVVGSNAAIADVDYEKHNGEALEVLKLVGAMVGDGTNISPDRKVTRNEAAVVLSHLLGGSEGYVAHPFTDVPDWANAAVALCYAEGITAGISATEYGGNNTITTLQAGLYVLKALGYFQGTNDLAIDGWEKATTKAAAEIKLFDGVTAKATEGLSRSDFAQIVFNALNASAPEVTGPVLAVDATGKMFSVYTYAAGEGETLAEALGYELKRSFGPNEITGRPEITWANGDDSTTFPMVPADKFTATSDWDDEDLADYLKANKWDDEDDFVAIGDDVTAGSEVEVYVFDVEEFAYLEPQPQAEVIFTGYDVVLFLNYAYDLVQIDSIEELTEKQIKDLEDTDAEDAKAIITIGEVEFYDIYFEGYEAFEEDQWILACAAFEVEGEDENDYNHMIFAKAATLVTGKIDAIKGSKYRINGTYYAEELTGTVKIGDEGTWALDAAGNLAAVVEAPEVKSSDYAYIYRVVKEEIKDAVNAEGVVVEGDVIYTVYVALEDGSKASYPVVVENNKIEGIEDALNFGEGTIADLGIVVAYEINKDGEFEVATATTEPETMTISASKDSAVAATGIFSTSETKYIFVKEDVEEKTIVVEVVTGYKNVNIEDKSAQVILNDDNEIVTAWIGDFAADLEADTTVLYAILADDDAVETEDEDGVKYYTYDVFVDGVATTLTYKANDPAFQANDVCSIIAYTMDGDYAVEASTSALQAGTVTYVGEDFYYVTSAFELAWPSGEFTAEGAELYTFTIDEDGVVSVEKATELAKDDVISFVQKDGEISLAFIRVVEE